MHFKSVRQKKGNIHNKTNKYRWHFRSKPHQTTSLRVLVLRIRVLLHKICFFVPNTKYLYLSSFRQGYFNVNIQNVRSAVLQYMRVKIKKDTKSVTYILYSIFTLNTHWYFLNFALWPVNTAKTLCTPSRIFLISFNTFYEEHCRTSCFDSERQKFLVPLVYISIFTVVLSST